MDLLKLFQFALGVNYPVRILVLSFQIFLAPRILRMGDWLSEPITVGKPIATGATSGTDLGKTMIYALLEDLHTCFPLVHAEQWVDDPLAMQAGAVWELLCASVDAAVVRVAFLCAPVVEADVGWCGSRVAHDVCRGAEGA